MNWKLRFRNKATLTAIIFAVIAIVYKILNLAGVELAITEGTVKEVVEMVIFLLCLLGIVVDPTTDGVGDSNRAMTYEEPWIDEEEEEDDEEDEA